MNQVEGKMVACQNAEVEKISSHELLNDREIFWEIHHQAV